MKRKFLISTIILLAFIFLLNPEVYAMQIFVKNLSGTNLTIEVESSDTIEAVKEKIYEEDDTPLDKYDLSYSGKRLEHGRTLSDYNEIIKDSTLDMVITKKITFDANGGLGTMETQSFIYGKVQEISANTFIRKDYVFKGWNTEKNGTGTNYNDKQEISIDEDITLYAQWLKLEFIDSVTIDFYNEIKNITKDHLNETQTVAFGLLVSNNVLIFDTENNKVFDKNGKELLSIDIAQNNEITLAENLSETDNIVYAVEETDYKFFTREGIFTIPKEIKIIFSNTRENYKITFDANGGVFKNNITTIDILDIINFNYEEFEKPTRDGFELVGFYTEDGKSYLDVMNSEDGVTENIIFYARWQEVSSSGVPGTVEPTQPDNTNIGNATTNQPTGNNPQTSDNIMVYVIILVLSIVGLSTTIITGKKVKKQFDI